MQLRQKYTATMTVSMDSIVSYIIINFSCKLRPGQLHLTNYKKLSTVTSQEKYWLLTHDRCFHSFMKKVTGP